MKESIKLKKINEKRLENGENKKKKFPNNNKKKRKKNKDKLNV